MKVLSEKQRIADNVAIYMKLNAYTNRTFAKAVGLSQSNVTSVVNGKIRNEKKFTKYIRTMTEQLGLEENYFVQPMENITSQPINFRDTSKIGADDSKLQTGNEKFNALSLMLKIGEIHYE
ncbi:hypothetical protein [Listeria ilorinensis]|uniref:hypothetical protein n=1 Tax=Listeria ilorinensis TaxID=2867439 RepID=UPI001EF66D3D|nr:hypothetical protein [Listeria ilorinensis]